MVNLFDGVSTAIVTPFKNNMIDYEALEKLICNQVDSNIDSIVLLGTTGESPTVSFKERKELIITTKALIKNKCKLIVGTGSNDMSSAEEKTKQAKELGADGVLVVTPYYNKCTNDGAIKYYENLNKINIPFLAYNVPSRTGFNLVPKVCCKISNFNCFAGIKEANSNIEQILELFHLLGDNIYSGNDNLNFIFSQLGAKGYVSVTSNILPDKVKFVYDNFHTCNSMAKTVFDEMYEINKLLFIEPNPIPVKFCLFKMGIIQNEFRLPLSPLSKEYENVIENQLNKLGLI